MKYDYKKTLKKILKSGVFVIIAGVASVYGDSSWYLSIAPILTGFVNYLGHRK